MFNWTLSTKTRLSQETHYLCLLILVQVWFFPQKIDLTKISHQNKIFFAMYNSEHFFSQFHLVLTLKISLINFITEKRVHSVTGLRLLCFLQINIFPNLQDDVEFHINHKLSRHSLGSLARSPPLEAWTNGACRCHLDGSGRTSFCFCRSQEYPDLPALNNLWYLLILVNNTMQGLPDCPTFLVGRMPWVFQTEIASSMSLCMNINSTYLKWKSVEYTIKFPWVLARIGSLWNNRN